MDSPMPDLTSPNSSDFSPVIVNSVSSGTSSPSLVERANLKVLHLINGEHFSGAERVQDLLAMAMPGFGYEIGFACVKPDKFPEVRHSKSSELFETRMNSKFDLWCAGRVVSVFQKHNYKMLHAHTPRTLLIGSLAARRLGCPLVYHVHSPDGRDSERGLTNKLNTMIESWSLRRVNRMICVSNSLSNYMAELGHAPEKIRVVSNGVAVIDDLPKREPPSKVWTCLLYTSDAADDLTRGVLGCRLIPLHKIHTQLPDTAITTLTLIRQQTK